MSAEYDAIVIGAGPAGSSAAIFLAQAGWRIALVEKQTFPRRKVCGECIGASNLPILERLGVGAAVSALAGPPLRQVAVMAGERTVRGNLPPLQGAGHPWGKALGREYLDTLLSERAVQCGADLFQPWTVKRIERSRGIARCEAIRVDTRERRTLQAPIVIAAHGSWELDLTQDRPRHPRPSDLFGFKANFRAPAMEPGLLAVVGFPGGYGGMVLGDHGATTVACCIRRDVLARCRGNDPGAKAAYSVQAYLAACCQGVADRLATATQTGSWLSVGPLRPGVRLGRRDPGIFRIGNAAGEAHPIIGEGMSMALQSAMLCSTLLMPHQVRLGDEHRIAQLQRQYESAWRRHFTWRLRLAAGFAHLAMRPVAAQNALIALHGMPGLLTWAARLSGKVTRAPRIRQEGPAKASSAEHVGMTDHSGV